MPTHALKGRVFILACALAFSAFALPGARAEVRLPALISDNMVLQQKNKATLWGEANPNEKISVKIGNVSQSTTASADGHWAMKLPPMKAGGPYDMTISGRGNEITIHNVLVGEVWVCSGQSNMQWHVREARDGEAEIADADFPEIRVFTVTKKISPTRQSDCEGRWEICSPATAGSFTAVGYYFARDVYNSLKVPVGLINSSSGSTTVEEWIPADGFDLDPELKSIAQEQDSQPMEKEEYKRRYAEWIAACDKAKADNQPLPPEPAAPKAAKPAEAPSSLFNGMIAPLLPCAIRGVIWYQGESNTRNAPLYRKLFPAMIRSWRDSWGQGDFPFLFVQLPGFLLKKSAPSQSAWAELREAQAVALKLPKTAMAVTIDIGDEHNLHPANKQDVGKRLALAAQANVYGQNIASSGPVFASSKVEGDKIAVTFKQTEGGLVVKGGGPPKGFAIAGADKQFVWADAEIDGDKVIVHSAQVPHPVSVRYAWADDPDANLYNRADLPAGPFRLDDW